MKSFQDRINEVPRGGWIRAGVWGALYIAFVIWVAWGDWKSLGWLALLPLIIDAFTTKYINYSWWRKYKDTKPALYTLCSWIDAIVFALVAVYFINLYIFQNYQIPSSSLEKSLRVGDFLYVCRNGSAEGRVISITRTGNTKGSQDGPARRKAISSFSISLPATPSARRCRTPTITPSSIITARVC